MVASINSPGIGSGLDVKGIVDKLVSIERRPIDLLKKEHAGIQSRMSSFGLIKSYLSNLSDTATALSDLPLWRTPKATSSDPSKLTLTSTDGGNTSGGNYSVQVDRLAQGQTVASTSVADPKASLGGGTLHVELGQWSADGTSFTPQADATPVDIAITPGQDSLENVRDRINSARAGLNASLVTDASGTRLVVHSSATGETNGFRITAGPAEDGTAASSGLSALTYDSAKNLGGGMKQTLAAQNAQLSVNGVEISSASNTISGAIGGVQLTLLKASGDAVSVSLTSDSDAIQKAINGMVNSINDLSKYIATQTKYDATSKTAAALQGDTTTLSILTALRKAISDPSSASSTFTRLLDIGVKVGADNTLSVDNTKLQAALANPTELSRALGAKGDTAQSDGLAVRFKKFAQTLLGVDGVVTTRNKAYTDANKRNEDQQAQLERRVSQVQDRLLAQYTALDSRMADLTSQSNYVNQQMQLLLKRSS